MFCKTFFKNTDTEKEEFRRGKMPYTYMVECSDGSLYTGWTVDLNKRVKAHNKGKGARYTRAKGPVKLVYWEEAETKVAAMKREAAIKKLSRAKKLGLLEKFKAAVTDDTLKKAVEHIK